MKKYEYKNVMIYGNYMEVISEHAEEGWRIVGVLMGRQFGYAEHQNILLLEKEKNED